MPTVTVNGAGVGQFFPVQYTTSDAFASATILANAINNIVATTGVSTQVLTSAGTVTPPAGQYGELVITNTSGTPFQVASGPDLIVVVNGTTPVSVPGSGLSNMSVIAGSGGLTFFAGANGGVNPTGVVVVAGDGSNLLGTATGTGGSVMFTTGAGNDVITAVAGTNTVHAGLGTNTILGGTSFDTIGSEGTDVIYGNQTTGGGTLFVTGAGTSVDDITAGSSNVIFNSGTSTGASTMFGGTGTDTVFSSIGGGSFFAGTGGNSSLVGGAGSVTLVGGATGDQLFSQPGSATTGSAYLVAGAGNETISAVMDSRGVQAFASSVAGSNDLIFGGAGNDTIVAGVGNATLSSGGGNDQFLFTNGKAGGSDIILGFTNADFIGLNGYTAPAGGTATAAGINAVGVAGVTVSGGDTFVTLSDNTKITMINYTSLNPSNFVG